MDRGGEYEFLVAERLSPTAIAAFDELAGRQRDGGGTVLSGFVRDQSELHGVLVRLQVLGLTLEGLTRVPRSSCGGISSFGLGYSDTTRDRGGQTVEDKLDAEHHAEVPERRDGPLEEDQQPEQECGGSINDQNALRSAWLKGSHEPHDPTHDEQ